MAEMSRSVSPTGTKGFPSASRNRTPRAVAAPQPPSLVALPPRPRMISSVPASRAASISSPAPKVVVFSGFFFSPAKGRPAAAAISTTAVRSFSRPHRAIIFSPQGPVTVSVIASPPTAARKASTVPSPPSATGMERGCQSGASMATARAMISQARAEDRLPLKESGIRIQVGMARSLIPAARAYSLMPRKPLPMISLDEVMVMKEWGSVARANSCSRMAWERFTTAMTMCRFCWV